MQIYFSNRCVTAIRTVTATLGGLPLTVTPKDTEAVWTAALHITASTHAETSLLPLVETRSWSLWLQGQSALKFWLADLVAAHAVSQGPFSLGGLFVCLFLVYLLWDTSALWIGGEILQLLILLLSSQNDKFHESSCKEMEVSWSYQMQAFI